MNILLPFLLLTFMFSHFSVSFSISYFPTLFLSVLVNWYGARTVLRFTSFSSRLFSFAAIKTRTIPFSPFLLSSLLVFPCLPLITNRLIGSHSALVSRKTYPARFYFHILYHVIRDFPPASFHSLTFPHYIPCPLIGGFFFHFSLNF